MLSVVQVNNIYRCFVRSKNIYIHSVVDTFTCAVYSMAQISKRFMQFLQIHLVCIANLEIFCLIKHPEHYL